MLFLGLEKNKLPKTNIAPGRKPFQKETLIFLCSSVSGAFAASFREGTNCDHQDISHANREAFSFCGSSMAAKLQISKIEMAMQGLPRIFFIKLEGCWYFFSGSMFIHFLYISCGGTLVGLPTAEFVGVSADDEQAWASYDRQEGAAEGVLPQLRGHCPG